ncbi:HNH endonuclease [Ralstonia syzygii subsp. celebesensis]|uniref:Putative HNH nuclease YajD n=1 Tax=blood disease bacterium R229 TaxID=741978 RepID=G2ZJ52_9RALS|nr:HNH endonuclease [Ralstonia syzygii]CCA79065.1 putative phage phi-105 holin-like protein [blood disease bacterium R229]
MPARPSSICRHPGCGRRVDVPGYCTEHKQHERQWDSTDRARARQAKRALATNSTAWRRLRESVLRDDPLCAECSRAGRVVIARLVDHIDGDATNNERSNLQGLCWPCHSAKTAREDGGFGNAKRAASPVPAAPVQTVANVGENRSNLPSEGRRRRFLATKGRGCPKV